MSIDETAKVEILTTQQLLDGLRSTLIDHLPPLNQVPGEKIKRLIVIWREILLHRIVDFADASLDMFRQERMGPACTLARSCYETIGHLYYFDKVISKATSEKDIRNIKDLLERGIFGSKDGSSQVNAIQVLTSIDHVDKTFKGFRGEYDNLCEFAHPNLKGGLGTYARISMSDGHVIFGKNPEGIPLTSFGLSALNIGMHICTELCDQFKKNERAFSLLLNYFPDLFLD